MTQLNGHFFNLLLISDCHLGKNPTENLGGVITAESLAHVLQEAISQETNFDLVLCSGDISNDGTQESYDRFVQLVQKHIPSTPIAWLPGNHDDPAGMFNHLTAPPISDFVQLGNWRLILLNSRVPFEERGELSQNELNRLERILQEDPHAPTLIFLHHQLVPVGSIWVDQYVVSNADKFFDIVDQYSNVRAVSWGHVHQEFLERRRGVDLIATPSTCVQFLPNSPDFAIDTLKPGYRTYKLHSSGHYATNVKRVVAHNYAIDHALTGY
jgi:3',5'-cyclic-AMP phosphodiesterase